MLGHSVCSIRESLPRLIGIDCLRATRQIANDSLNSERRPLGSAIGHSCATRSLKIIS